MSTINAQTIRDLKAKNHPPVDPMFAPGVSWQAAPVVAEKIAEALAAVSIPNAFFFLGQVKVEVNKCLPDGIVVVLDQGRNVIKIFEVTG